MRALVWFLFLTLFVAGLPAASAQGPVARPVGFTFHAVDAETIDYPVLSGDGESLGTLSWRVIDGLGNCCEGYVAATPTGRLLEFGGTYLRFSDNRGETWFEVNTPVPYFGGEGTVSAAPGGDVVAVGWAPYTGDQLWAHKYEADNNQWYYMPIAVHTPFFDRPWLAVVPGPIDTLTDDSEYAVLLDGWPSHKAHLASLDGLQYDQVTNQHRTIPGPDDALVVTPDPVLDWVQPNRGAEILPLGGGMAVGPAYLGSCGSGRIPAMDPDLLWRCHTSAIPQEAVVSDSRGWLHQVKTFDGATTFTYRTSTDHGATWNETVVDLPAPLAFSDDDAFDLAVHGGMGIAALAVHAVDRTTGHHQDLVVRIDTRLPDAVVLETALVGEGGFRFGANAASTAPRFDFSSVAILPDGRIATSFKDIHHKDTAAIAVEQVVPALPSLTGAQAAAGSGPTDEVEKTLEELLPGPALPMPRFTLHQDGARIEVDGTPSWDPDGQVRAHVWDWGDGSTGADARRGHTYAAPGAYTVTLLVTDDAGHQAALRRTVHVDADDMAMAAEAGGPVPSPAVLVLMLLVGLAAVQAVRRSRP